MLLNQLQTSTRNTLAWLITFGLSTSTPYPFNLFIHLSCWDITPLRGGEGGVGCQGTLYTPQFPFRSFCSTPRSLTQSKVCPTSSSLTKSHGLYMDYTQMESTRYQVPVAFYFSLLIIFHYFYLFLRSYLLSPSRIQSSFHQCRVFILFSQDPLLGELSCCWNRETGVST